MKKSHYLVINNRNFAINFDYLNGEILEFNGYIFELLDIKKTETISILLCSENQFFNINFIFLHIKNILKRCKFKLMVNLED